jgi:hypothetical protein
MMIPLQKARGMTTPTFRKETALLSRSRTTKSPGQVALEKIEETTMQDSIGYQFDRKILEITVGDETFTFKDVPVGEYMRIMDLLDKRAFVDEIRGRFEQVMC